MERGHHINPLWLLRRRLVPPEEVAGIEITDAFCRLLLLDPETLNVLAAAETRLPPGTIAGGKVQSLANLEAAFRALKNGAGAAFSHNPIAILSLPPAIFFTHVLSLPDIPEESFEEAARLNATQLSPIKMQEAYFDWQNLGVNLETLERELYIAVASRDAIDPYLEAARRAGIDIVAVEPGSLGLIRVFTYFVTAADKHAAFLLTRVSSDGMDFVIAKEGKPFFSYFFFWKDVPEAAAGAMTGEGFKTVTRRGVAKVTSFFTTRYKEPLVNAALFAPIFQAELAAVLKDEFGMKVAGYRLPVFRGAPLPETWTGVLGAALRGIVPRGEDTVVSLMPVGTEELFRRKQVAAYVAFWGKTIAAMLSLFIVVFAGIFALAASMRKNVIETLSVQRRSENAVAAENLARKAREFNELVANALLAESREEVVADELRAIAEAAGTDVIIRQLSIFAENKQMRLTAFGRDRAAALAFTRELAASGKFMEVDLPLAFVRDIPGGVEFNVTARFE